MEAVHHKKIAFAAESAFVSEYELAELFGADNDARVWAIERFLFDATEHTQLIADHGDHGGWLSWLSSVEPHFTTEDEHVEASETGDDLDDDIVPIGAYRDEEPLTYDEWVKVRSVVVTADSQVPIRALLLRGYFRLSWDEVAEATGQSVRHAKKAVELGQELFCTWTLGTSTIYGCGRIDRELASELFDCGKSEKASRSIEQHVGECDRCELVRSKALRYLEALATLLPPPVFEPLEKHVADELDDVETPVAPVPEPTADVVEADDYWPEDDDELAASDDLSEDPYDGLVSIPPGANTESDAGGGPSELEDDEAQSHERAGSGMRTSRHLRPRTRFHVERVPRGRPAGRGDLRRARGVALVALIAALMFAAGSLRGGGEAQLPETTVIVEQPRSAEKRANDRRDTEQPRPRRKARRTNPRRRKSSRVTAPTVKVPAPAPVSSAGTSDGLSEFTPEGRL